MLHKCIYITCIVTVIYLVGSVLQSHGADPGVHLAIFLNNRLEAAPRGPLQDEAKGMEDNTHKLNDIRVTEMTQNWHLSTNLKMYQIITQVASLLDNITEEIFIEKEASAKMGHTGVHQRG